MEKIITGSEVFFSGIEGFTPHDHDAIQIVDARDVNFLFRRQMFDHSDNTDTFYVVMQPKEAYIKWAAKFAIGTTLGQFLTPAFCEVFGITVADLVKLKPLRDRLDRRHHYQAIIYDAYLENGSMTLTDEQRTAAYTDYLQSRGLNF